MKIFNKGRPKQFSFTKVTCLDSLMVEMINCVPDSAQTMTEDHIEALRLSQNNIFIHTFFYGAGLKVGTAKNEFFVYTFAGDGSDGLAAFEELKMLDALRLAKKHFLAMKKACFNPNMDAFTLRVTSL